MAALAATPLAARAQTLPPSITLILGSAPGGTTDALAREVAKAMREKLARNVVVENRAGAGGNIAAAAAASDGGTLLVAALMRGGDIPALSSAELGAFLARDMALWIEVARLGNIQPQ